ncbi:ABC transporter permease [Sciscionella sediminilitoris]|uniref:ABC transporter permease n=1 Tax=Sciscionella sediminilitoris TaxID=1445613 RepID=UPI0004DF7D6D|nr:ABC transporter permease [Sciscionella sp. SE31]
MNPTGTAAPETGNKPSGRGFLRRFRRHRFAMAGLAIVLVLAFCCYFANIVAPFEQNDQHLLLGAKPPSWRHLLGTDQLGRDYLTEILYAGRLSLTIGLSVAVLSTVVGTVLGVIAGYAGRWIGEVVMRITDLFLVVPPLAVLAVALQGLGRSYLIIVLVLAGIGWTVIARVVRGEVLALRERAYVDAALVLGASHLRIVLRHLLPNLAGVAAVSVSVNVATSIILESTLSFLGFGVRPPQSSWGNMLSQASGYVGTPQGYLLYFPGLAILITVLAVSFVGDGLRDAFDPRRKQ